MTPAEYAIARAARQAMTDKEACRALADARAGERMQVDGSLEWVSIAGRKYRVIRVKAQAAGAGAEVKV